MEDSFDTARRRIKWRAGLTLVVISMIFGAITGIMWEGATDVVSGQLTGGTITAFIFAGVLTASSFGALTEVWGDILRGAGAASRLGELLQAEPDIARPAKAVDMPAPRGSLAFDHVTFRYPTRPDDRALDDFTLTVEPGETVAVVGPSGAGKTSLIQSLAGKFRRNVCYLSSLSHPEMTDDNLKAAVQRVPARSLVVLEDVDALWEGGRLKKSGDKSAGQIGLAKSGSTAADFLLGTGGAEGVTDGNEGIFDHASRRSIAVDAFPIGIDPQRA